MKKGKKGKRDRNEGKGMRNRNERKGVELILVKGLPDKKRQCTSTLTGHGHTKAFSLFLRLKIRQFVPYLVYVEGDDLNNYIVLHIV